MSIVFAPKRQRDLDELQQSRQILPVANLSEDFNGDPEDGMQYLFTVRRDARKLPHTTRVANPYERPEPMPDLVSSTSSMPHPGLPSAEWQAIFLHHFSNLRKNSVQPTLHIGPRAPRDSSLIPAMRERERWWAFLAGRPSTDWTSQKPSKAAQPVGLDMSMDAWCNGSQQRLNAARVLPASSDDPSLCRSQPPGKTSTEGAAAIALNAPPPEPVAQVREPTPEFLGAMDERTPLHLLKYFNHWIQLHLADGDRTDLQITDTHARWIFALLSRIDDYLSADDMALLRSLARSCIALIRSQTAYGHKIAQASCWMIITAITGTWAQRDLWSEAESMLNELSKRDILG